MGQLIVRVRSWRSTRSAPLGWHACSRSRPTSNPCPSTHQPPGPSGAWRLRCGALAAPAARAYGGMIAAVALANGLPIYTCNPQDFAGIDDLEVLDVPLADA